MLDMKQNITKAKIYYWEYFSMPQEHIYVNFAGLTFKHIFFLIVDAHNQEI